MSNRVALDLKQFKHIKSDGKSTTLQHKDGHILTIAHKALTPDNQKQLNALSKIAPSAMTSTQADEASKQKMAHGGGIESTINNLGSKANTIMGVEGQNAVPKDKQAPDESNNGTDVRTQDQKDKAKTFEQTGELPEWKPGMAKGGTVCKHCGGGVKMYADPTEEVSSKDSAPTKQDFEKANLLKDIDLNSIKSMVQQRNDSPIPKAPISSASQPAPFSDESLAEGVKSLSTIQKPDAGLAGMISPNIMSSKMPQEAPAAPATPAPAAPAPATSMLTPEEQAQQRMLSGEQRIAQPSNDISGRMQDTESVLEKGYQNRLAGIGAEAAAKGDLGVEQAKLLNHQVEAENKARTSYQNTFNELEQERQAHMADIKEGHIDPNQYWTGDKNGNGSHSRVATAIGMIIAGFNPTDRPNAAIDLLKFNMEQNLNSQKANLDSENNLLNANLRQFGNLKDATDMTRVMLSDVTQHELLKAAATAQTPMAKAAALEAAGKLQVEMAPVFQQFALRKAMMGLAKQGPENETSLNNMLGYMRVMNPEMAKEMEGRYVPGVGLASVPVPQEVRSEIAGKQEFDTMSKQYLNFVKQHSNNWANLNPVERAKISNQGATMAADLQGAYRRASKGGTFKEGEQEFIEQLIPSKPDQFGSTFRTLPKIEQIIHNNQTGFDVLRRSYGLPTPKAQATDTQSAESTVTGKDGRQYKRVGNYMVPVK
jgi:hypothetical protein